MTRDELKQVELPDEPGVYKFVRGGEILYVGKATSLRDRVRSYFMKDVGVTRSPAIQKMVEEAETINYETTDSVLEALILEANLIKEIQPKYNVAEKDNKSYNYVVMTKEDFPRVLTVRGRELFQSWNQKDIKEYFGPFPQGGALKEAMKIIRKIFPFRDKCEPCTGIPQGRTSPDFGSMQSLDLKACKPCFNAQIGLCPNVCGGGMSREEYAERIKSLIELFSGRSRQLKRRLAKEMESASENEEFEKAMMLKKQVGGLSHIYDVALIKDEYRAAAGGGIRVEAYDVAHTSGTETVGVMTVVQDSSAQKAEYRKFTIRTVTNNDTGALREMLERRLEHTEWTYPRVIVVDGSVSQLRVARNVLERVGVKIPVVGVVKNAAHKPERLIGDSFALQAYEREILLANQEAHRFAIDWHRKKRGALFK